MSKIEARQMTVKQVFLEAEAGFLIPDYQRPYAWGEEECLQLWEDIVTFAIPDEDSTKFDEGNEYYLGSIVTCKNNSKREVIDGQQRLTTLLLLLRAFYEKLGDMKHEKSEKARTQLAECIWITFRGEPDRERPRIESVVVMDDDKGEFLSILKDGNAKEYKDGSKMKSRYAENYLFFQKQIGTFKSKYADYFLDLVWRTMEKVTILSVDAGDRESALRIFSTLNDRGHPLSDADIFKAKFYDYYDKIGKTDVFVEQWKNLEERCKEMFDVKSGNPLDELFSRYRYFIRAKQEINGVTMQGLRAFYEGSIKNEKYPIAFDKELFDNLTLLAEFWSDVEAQKRFNGRVLRRLYVLRSAPNSMWANIVSVYFMQNKDGAGMLDDEPFCRFLAKITAFIWAYTFMKPGVSALRAPVFAEMANIVNQKAVEFSNYKFGEAEVRAQIEQTEFTNQKPITRSMLTWWAFRDEEKPAAVPSPDEKFDIEHIYARNLGAIGHEFSDKKNLESLGNKSLLESSINRLVRDHDFRVKRKYYRGKVEGKGEGTMIQELKGLADKDDFTEADIIARKEQMLNAFIDFLKENNLIK